MVKQTKSSLKIFHPKAYRICVSGRLDPVWGERLGGMSVSYQKKKGRTSITELVGQLPDQAALMGVLEQLYNMGISILSVKTKTVALRTHVRGAHTPQRL